MPVIVEIRQWCDAGVSLRTGYLPPVVAELEREIVDREHRGRIRYRLMIFESFLYQLGHESCVPIMAMDDIGLQVQEDHELQGGYREDKKTALFMLGAIGVLFPSEVLVARDEIDRQAPHQLASIIADPHL